VCNGWQVRGEASPRGDLERFRRVHTERERGEESKERARWERERVWGKRVSVRGESVIVNM